MSYFGFRFDKIKGDESKELKDLYRVRDLDPQWVDYFKKFAINQKNTSDNKNSFFITKNMNHPNDPLWNGMTEEERVECGRPTKFLRILFSKPAFFLLSIWMCAGIYQYGKIYIPGGVVLMAQRKETAYQYLM